MLRITPQLLAANAVRYSQGHLANLTRLQTEISTGLRIRVPSDAPSEIGPLLANRASIDRIDVELLNIEVTRSKLNQSVAQLLTVQDALTRTNSLALEGIQANPDERETIAREVNGILELLVKISNSTDGGKPIYAGTSKDLNPFVVTAYNEHGEPSEISYRGSEERSRIVVGVLTTTDALYTGEEIFMGNERSETLFLGDSGATSGTGTDTATGFGELTVRHTTTTYFGTSGIQPGTSSADDTVIGNHVLTVNSTDGTLQLDGGNPYRFTPGDLNVEVISVSGARVFVDTSSLVPGFNGQVNLRGDGTLSVDGGLSETPIVFGDNQAVIHSETGAITNINPQTLDQAATDQVEYLGTSSMFQVLMDLRDDLRNARDLPPGAWVDSMDRRIGEVQRIHDYLMDVVAEQSVDLENLDGLQRRAEDYQLETEIAVAAVESADITDAIVKMQTEQNALQYTYAVTAQIMNTSLLDFLR